MANNTRLHRPPPIIEMTEGELTPELKNRVLDVQIKQEEKKIDHEINDEWQCCCFKEKTDARMMKYLFQMSVLIGIIILCIVRLSDTNIDCATSNTYVSLISLMIGIICPSPKLN